MSTVRVPGKRLTKAQKKALKRQQEEERAAAAAAAAASQSIDQTDNGTFSGNDEDSGSGGDGGGGDGSSSGGEGARGSAAPPTLEQLQLRVAHLTLCLEEASSKSQRTNAKRRLKKAKAALEGAGGAEDPNLVDALRDGTVERPRPVHSSPLSNLPPEILANVIQHLPIRDLRSMALTSRYWSAIVKQESQLIARDLYTTYWTASELDWEYNDWVHLYHTRKQFLKTISTTPKHMHKGGLSKGDSTAALEIIDYILEAAGSVYNDPMATPRLVHVSANCDVRDGEGDIAAAVVRAFALAVPGTLASLSTDRSDSKDVSKLLARVKAGVPRSSITESGEPPANLPPQQTSNNTDTDDDNNNNNAVDGAGLSVDVNPSSTTNGLLPGGVSSVSWLGFGINTALCGPVAHARYVAFTNGSRVGIRTGGKIPCHVIRLFDGVRTFVITLRIRVGTESMQAAVAEDVHAIEHQELCVIGEVDQELIIQYRMRLEEGLLLTPTSATSGGGGDSGWE